jgi:hypothetical protein
MLHMMEGEWSVLQVDSAIDCTQLYKLAKSRGLVPQEIPIESVSHKPLSNIKPSSGRYIAARVFQPSVVCFGMINPHNKPYRMLDGRHRLLKRMNEGYTSVLSYVLQVEDVIKFVQLIPNNR